MGLDYRRVRLNEATGMFEEVPTLGSRVASVFRCLGVLVRGLWTLVKLPFVLAWWIVCLPFRGIAAIGRGIGRVRWKRILSRRLGICARPLGVLFAPVAWWWRNEREAYREGDWFMVVICLLPGYFIYLAYKYLLLLLVGLCGGFLVGILVWAWQFVSALVVWLWRLAYGVSVWLWALLEEVGHHYSPVVIEWFRGVAGYRACRQHGAAQIARVERVKLHVAEALRERKDSVLLLDNFYQNVLDLLDILLLLIFSLLIYSNILNQALLLILILYCLSSVINQNKSSLIHSILIDIPSLIMTLHLILNLISIVLKISEILISIVQTDQEFLFVDSYFITN